MEVLVIEQDELKLYIKEKLKMLKRDFRIRLSDAEVAHIRSLKTEIAVDNYCRSLFDRM